MAAHLSPEWTGSGAGTLPSPWVRACPPACCVGVRVCTRTTACTRTHCGLTTASAGSASPPKTAAKNTQQSSNHWPVTPVVFPPPNAACQLTTTVEDAPRKTDWRGETDPDLLSTVKTILGERGCGRHSGKSREQTFGDSADPSARLTPGPMNEGLCSGIQDASPPWVHVGTAASPGQGPELPAAGGPPPGPSALSPPPNTAGKTDHTDAPSACPPGSRALPRTCAGRQWDRRPGARGELSRRPPTAGGLQNPSSSRSGAATHSQGSG